MELIFPDSPRQWIALLLLTVLVLFIIPSGAGGSGGCYKAPPPKGSKPDTLPPGWDGQEKMDSQQEVIELLKETILLLRQLLDIKKK